MRPIIVVTQPIPGDAVARLRQIGDVTYRTTDGTGYRHPSFSRIARIRRCGVVPVD
jgi:hypothetical protein